MRQILMTKREGFERCGPSNSEGENPSKARLERAGPRRIDKSGTAPESGQYGDVLDTIDRVGDGRSHDAGARVERPDFLTIGGAIGREYPIRTPLKYQVAAHQNTTALDR